MRSGDRPGLQNRRAAGSPVTGGFDPHSLPPSIFNPFSFERLGLRSDAEDLYQAVRDHLVLAVLQLPDSKAEAVRVAGMTMTPAVPAVIVTRRRLRIAS